MASNMSLVLFLLVVTLPFIYVGSSFELQDLPPITGGLSWTFYDSRCPRVEAIIRSELVKAFQRNIGLAAGLLRIHFHDCFVQGCDGSVLLDGSGSEKEAPPNLTLRASAFALINSIKALINQQCGNVVSCADVAALAARDSVFLSGGPDYPVPLGRRDSLTFANTSTVLEFLPPPSSKVPELIAALAKLNLNTNDLVALSGGHTIGIGHCPSFDDRLYPNQDPTLDKTFANNLKNTCPVVNFNASTVLDIRSPNTFDNRYYVDLMNRQGLFTSDQDLYTDRTTRSIVTDFAIHQSLFFQSFVSSMIKMGQISVLTGSQGEIRQNCSVKNPVGGSEGSLRSFVGGDVAASY